MCLDAAPSTITNASSTHNLSRHHSDDEDDHDLELADAEQPNTGGGQRGTAYANVVQLKRSPGELALFLNFAVHHSDPTNSVGSF